MKFLLEISCLTAFLIGNAQSKEVKRWERFELSLKGPSAGNPFNDVRLTANFLQGNQKITVNGFYDGDGIYRIRFMPDKTGQWQYITKSNAGALDSKKGNFVCVAAKANNHGPVHVAQTWHFKYADGKWYYPFGTTIYAWIHQGEGLQEQTLQTLSKTGFNKVRMCAFPKYYTYVEEDTALYSFPQVSFHPNKKKRFTWDLTRFNPAFFQHLEKKN